MAAHITFRKTAQIIACITLFCGIATPVWATVNEGALARGVGQTQRSSATAPNSSVSDNGGFHMKHSQYGDYCVDANNITVPTDQAQAACHTVVKQRDVLFLEAHPDLFDKLDAAAAKRDPNIIRVGECEKFSVDSLADDFGFVDKPEECDAKVAKCPKGGGYDHGSTTPMRDPEKKKRRLRCIGYRAD